MSAGRRPTPTSLKLLRGNPGKRALNANEPQPMVALPVRPENLSDRAAKAWDRIAPELAAMGVLTVADGPALELLADAFAEWHEAREVVRAEGATYASETQNGTMIRPRPEVGIASDAWRRIKSMLVEFGLTPSSRSRIQVQTPEEADKTEEKLFGSRGAG